MNNEVYIVEIRAVKQNGEIDVYDDDIDASNHTEATPKARAWVKAKWWEIPKEVGKKGSWTLTHGLRRTGLDGGQIDLSPDAKEPNL